MIYDILDLFWHYIGRWIVAAVGVALIATVFITVAVLLWWIFLPLAVVFLGVWLISLAAK